MTARYRGVECPRCREQQQELEFNAAGLVDYAQRHVTARYRPIDEPDDRVEMTGAAFDALLGALRRLGDQGEI